MEPLEHALDHPGGFFRWLDNHSDNVIVGDPDSATTCPLAIYLLSRGERDILVRSAHYGHMNRNIRLPMWARRFVAAVDRDKPFGDRITAKRAKEHLRRAIAGLIPLAEPEPTPTEPVPAA